MFKRKKTVGDAHAQVLEFNNIAEYKNSEIVELNETIEQLEQECNFLVDRRKIILDEIAEEGTKLSELKAKAKEIKLNPIIKYVPKEVIKEKIVYKTKEVPVEVIVEKEIKVPYEVIKEVPKTIIQEKIVEKIVEIPVEKIVEVEKKVYIDDKDVEAREKELAENKKNLLDSYNSLKAREEELAFNIAQFKTEKIKFKKQQVINSV